MGNGLKVLAACLSLAASGAVAMPVNYDEATDGDLPTYDGYTPSNYPEFNLELGNNRISGTYHFSYWGTGSTFSSDWDCFYFRVPEGTQVASMTFYFDFTSTAGLSEFAYYFAVHNMSAWDQLNIYGIPYPVAFDEIWLIPGPYPGYPPANSSPTELFVDADFGIYYTSTPVIVGAVMPLGEGRYWLPMGHLQSGEGELDMTYRLEMLLRPIQRPVPEPGTLALLGLGLAGLLTGRRKAN